MASVAGPNTLDLRCYLLVVVNCSFVFAYLMSLYRVRNDLGAGVLVAVLLVCQSRNGNRVVFSWYDMHCIW